MDFSQFDQRGRDEAGTPHPILHPESLEPIVDPDTDKPCLVLVRGPTAPSAVRAEVVRSRAQMLNPLDPTNMALIEVHDYNVEVALPFIAGFENMTKADGSPFTEADAPYFLSMNMPRLERSEDGTFFLGNTTFAQQIINIVTAEKAKLGNAPAP